MKIKEKKKDGGHMSWFLRGRKIDKKKKLVAVVYSKARSCVCCVACTFFEEFLSLVPNCSLSQSFE